MPGPKVFVGLIAAIFLLLVVLYRRGALIRLPGLFLAAIGLLLWLGSPAPVVDVLVAMVERKSYAGIFFAFLFLTVVSFVIAFIRLGITTLSLGDVCLCLLPASALFLLANAATPHSTVAAGLGVLAGCAIACWLPAACPGLVARGDAVLLTLGVAYGALALYLWYDPLTFPNAAGPLIIFVLGLSLIAIILTALLQFPRAAIGFLCVWLAFNAYAKAFSVIPIEVTAGRTPTEVLEAWLATREDLVARYRDKGRPMPLIVMSAEGGGIYAAMHSFLALSAITYHCPRLKRHVFATVGVSGGALGFVMERALAASVSDTPCTDSAAPKPKLIINDLLSPVLANLLIQQPIAWLIPFRNTLPDGGSALARTLAYALGPASNTLSINAADAALIFVTTEARSGLRVVFSPITVQGARDVRSVAITNDTLDGKQGSDAVIHAAVTSARFPFLTQSAMLSVAGVNHVLVDGGYADNTGALTATNLIGTVKKAQAIGWGKGGCDKLYPVFAATFTDKADWRDCRFPLFLAHVAIAADAGEAIQARAHEPTPTSQTAQPTMFDPLLAMLGSRVSAARRALLALEEGQRNPQSDTTFHVNDGFYPHRIAQDDLALPLSWQLSLARTEAIFADIAPIKLCSRMRGAEDGLFYAVSEGDETAPSRDPDSARHATIRRRTGCSMRLLMNLVDFDEKVSIVGFN